VALALSRLGRARGIGGRAVALGVAAGSPARLPGRGSGPTGRSSDMPDETRHEAADLADYEVEDASDTLDGDPGMIRSTEA